MLCNKNLKPIATELLIRGRISFVFITQSYFAVAEDIIFYGLFSYGNSKYNRT